VQIVEYQPKFREKYITSMFRIEEQGKQEISLKRVPPERPLNFN
jgi:hypothetical protein